MQNSDFYNCKLQLLVLRLLVNELLTEAAARQRSIEAGRVDDGECGIVEVAGVARVEPALARLTDGVLDAFMSMCSAPVQTCNSRRHVIDERQCIMLQMPIGYKENTKAMLGIELRGRFMTPRYLGYNYACSLSLL